ncbi:MAG TPA: oxidoreductase, partial [Planctomycetaceae bacterium]|nr:oxidoreductase [Planctomycetaceae bacterium]
YPGYLKRVEISGSAGSAVIEEEDIVKWDFTVAVDEDAEIRERMVNRKLIGEGATGGGAADPAAIGYHGHALLIADMIEAVQNDGKPAVDGYEGRRSVEIILGIYAAAQSGAVVSLPLSGDPELIVRREGMTRG